MGFVNLGRKTSFVFPHFLIVLKNLIAMFCILCLLCFCPQKCAVFRLIGLALR